MRVLIIDDDRAHGESLSDLLNSRGHEAYFAASLADASWLLDLFRFQLAILDYDMPGVTGLEIARELLRRSPKLIPIVMSAREVTRESREELGSHPFLSKPIQVESLLALITALGCQQAGTSLTPRMAFPLERYGRDDEE